MVMCLIYILLITPDPLKVYDQWQSVTNTPLNSEGGIRGNFLSLKKVFVTDQ